MTITADPPVETAPEPADPPAPEPRTITVAKVYPSIGVGTDEVRVATVPKAVITEELTDVLRATATALGLRWLGGAVEIAVQPAPVEEYGENRVLVMCSGECARPE